MRVELLEHADDGGLHELVLVDGVDVIVGHDGLGHAELVVRRHGTTGHHDEQPDQQRHDRQEYLLHTL